MRKQYSLVALAVCAPLVACELQPGPKQAPKPAPAEPAAPTAQAPTPPSPPSPAPPTPSGIDAGVRIEITAGCLEVGAHVADVLIRAADPAQRAVFETERDRIVRSGGEVCTTQKWSEPAQKCYMAAATTAALKTCETQFTPAPTTPAVPKGHGDGEVEVGSGGMRAEPAGSAAPRPGAGSGSAAAPRPQRPTTIPGAGVGHGTAAPAAGSAAGAGSAAPRPAAGGLMPPPRAGSGSGH